MQLRLQSTRELLAKVKRTVLLFGHAVCGVESVVLKSDIRSLSSHVTSVEKTLLVAVYGFTHLDIKLPHVPQPYTILWSHIVLLYLRAYS